MPSSTAFGRVIKINVTGSYRTTFDGNDLEIHFECPFSDEPQPNISTVDIYNLSNSTISKIKKGGNCTVQAGYKGDYGVLSSGKITNVSTAWQGPDKVTTITFQEGEDISSKTDKVNFKKGTHGTTIIKRLCQDTGIKLAQLSVPYNKVYTGGLEVDGEVQSALEEVVKDCKASMYYRRGKLVIRSIKEGFDEQFTLDSNGGLLDSPTPFDDETTGKGFSFRSLLSHRMSVASVINVKSHTANGKYRLKNGTHSCTGTDFTTEGSMI